MIEYYSGTKMTNNNDLQLKLKRYSHTLLKKPLQMMEVLKLAQAKNQ